jgi:hypothetical protein
MALSFNTVAVVNGECTVPESSLTNVSFCVVDDGPAGGVIAGAAIAGAVAAGAPIAGAVAAGAAIAGAAGWAPAPAPSSSNVAVAKRRVVAVAKRRVVAVAKRRVCRPRFDPVFICHPLAPHRQRAFKWLLQTTVPRDLAEARSRGDPVENARPQSSRTRRKARPAT